MLKIIKNATLVALTSLITLLVATDRCNDNHINLWYKISTDALNPGELISLDMSYGYAFTEGSVIYLVVQTADSSKEQVVIAFPNGGYWEAPKADAFLMELQQEFDSLEDYLRKQGTEIQKK
jgi:hypothetical protein